MVGGEAGNIAEAHRELAQVMVDVVVQDLEMEGKLQFAWLAELRQRWPAVPLLVFSVHDQPSVVKRCRALKVYGYQVKTAELAEVVAAIPQVAQCREYLPPYLARLLTDRVAPPVRGREDQAYRLLGEGLAVKEIAARLEISPKTVYTYCERLRDKLGLGDQTALWRQAVQEAGTRHQSPGLSAGFPVDVGIIPTRQKPGISLERALMQTEPRPLRSSRPRPLPAKPAARAAKSGAMLAHSRERHAS